jgi:hypothetical protein
MTCLFIYLLGAILGSASTKIHGILVVNSLYYKSVLIHTLEWIYMPVIFPVAILLNVLISWQKINLITYNWSFVKRRLFGIDFGTRKGWKELRF